MGDFHRQILYLWKKIFHRKEDNSPIGGQCPLAAPRHDITDRDRPGCQSWSRGPIFGRPVAQVVYAQDECPDLFISVG